MSRPVFEAVDGDTRDLLSLLAQGHPAVGTDVEAAFLDACERDARTHDGIVSVNRVRALLAGLTPPIPPRRYSALWAHHTGRGKAMEKVPDQWEVCAGSTSGNDGRPFTLRRWKGWTA